MARTRLTVGLTLIVLGLVAWRLTAQPRISFRKELIEQDALAMIDFSQLDPAVAQFIEQAQHHKSSGQLMSDFPDLWQMALSQPQSENHRLTYNFLLPVPASQRAQIDEAAAAVGTPCWPMLMVDVDTRTSRITFVAIYVQCL